MQLNCPCCKRAREGTAEPSNRWVPRITKRRTRGWGNLYHWCPNHKKRPMHTPDACTLELDATGNLIASMNRMPQLSPQALHTIAESGSGDEGGGKLHGQKAFGDNALCRPTDPSLQAILALLIAHFVLQRWGDNSFHVLEKHHRNCCGDIHIHSSGFHLPSHIGVGQVLHKYLRTTLKKGGGIRRSGYFVRLGTRYQPMQVCRTGLYQGALMVTTRH